MSHWVLQMQDGTYAVGRGRVSSTPDLDKARVFTSQGAARNSYPAKYGHRQRCLAATPVRVTLALCDD